jgi:hypothetical protein
MTEIDGLPFREPPVFIIGETSEPQRTSAALVLGVWPFFVHFGRVLMSVSVSQDEELGPHRAA